METNFKHARKETQDWVFGMGAAVTDKEAPKRIEKASSKDHKSFISGHQKSLLW